MKNKRRNSNALSSTVPESTGTPSESGTALTGLEFRFQQMSSLQSPSVTESSSNAAAKDVVVAGSDGHQYYFGNEEPNPVYRCVGCRRIANPIYVLRDAATYIPTTFCATCKKALNADQQKLAVRDEMLQHAFVSQLKVLCPNNQAGCAVKPKLTGLDEHILACEWQVVPCDFHDMGCEFEDKRRDIHLHNDECTFRSTNVELIRKIRDIEKRFNEKLAALAGENEKMRSELTNENSLLRDEVKTLSLRLDRDSSTGSKVALLEASTICSFSKNSNSALLKNCFVLPPLNKEKMNLSLFTCIGHYAIKALSNNKQVKHISMFLDDGERVSGDEGITQWHPVIMDDIGNMLCHNNTLQFLEFSMGYPYVLSAEESNTLGLAISKNSTIADLRLQHITLTKEGGEILCDHLYRNGTISILSIACQDGNVTKQMQTIIGMGRNRTKAIRQ